MRLSLSSGWGEPGKRNSPQVEPGVDKRFSAIAGSVINIAENEKTAINEGYSGLINFEYRIA